MNLGTMFLACLLIGMLSIQRAATVEKEGDEGLLDFIAGLATLMMMMRGFYWNVFDQGHGIWTGNRASALAVFAAIYFGPQVYDHLHRRGSSTSERR